MPNETIRAFPLMKYFTYLADAIIMYLTYYREGRRSSPTRWSRRAAYVQRDTTPRVRQTLNTIYIYTLLIVVLFLLTIPLIHFSANIAEDVMLFSFDYGAM